MAITILITLQTLILLAGVGFYIYKNRPQPEPAPEILIEHMPKITKGYGYVKGNSLLLNEEGVPHIFKTYGEAKSKMDRFEGAEKVIFQQWDLETQQVFVGEVKCRWDKQTIEE